MSYIPNLKKYAESRNALEYSDMAIQRQQRMSDVAPFKAPPMLRRRGVGSNNIIAQTDKLDNLKIEMSINGVLNALSARSKMFDRSTPKPTAFADAFKKFETGKYEDALKPHPYASDETLYEKLKRQYQVEESLKRVIPTITREEIKRETEVKERENKMPRSSNGGADGGVSARNPESKGPGSFNNQNRPYQPRREHVSASAPPPDVNSQEAETYAFLQGRLAEAKQGRTNLNGNDLRAAEQLANDELGIPENERKEWQSERKRSPGKLPILQRPMRLGPALSPMPRSARRERPRLPALPARRSLLSAFNTSEGPFARVKPNRKKQANAKKYHFKEPNYRSLEQSLQNDPNYVQKKMRARDRKPLPLRIRRDLEFVPVGEGDDISSPNSAQIREMFGDMPPLGHMYNPIKVKDNKEITLIKALKNTPHVPGSTQYFYTNNINEPFSYNATNAVEQKIGVLSTPHISQDVAEHVLLPFLEVRKSTKQSFDGQMHDYNADYFRNLNQLEGIASAVSKKSKDLSSQINKMKNNFRSSYDSLVNEISETKQENAKIKLIKGQYDADKKYLGKITDVLQKAINEGKIKESDIIRPTQGKGMRRRKPVRKIKKGKGVKFAGCLGVKDLKSQLEILLGERGASNNNPQIVNDALDIAKELFRRKAISKPKLKAINKMLL